MAAAEADAFGDVDAAELRAPPGWYVELRAGHHIRVPDYSTSQLRNEDRRARAGLVEPFCEIGLAIKEQSPFPVTFLCGYTNGRMAYMPTADEWSKGGYEVENSPFGQDAAESLQDQILATLRTLRTKQN